MELIQEWSPMYIILSYIIACIGSATSLQIMKRKDESKKIIKFILFIAGSIA